MTPEQIKEWDRFYSGEWVKEMPKKLGCYVKATSQGTITGLVHVVWNPIEGCYFTPEHPPMQRTNFSGRGPAGNTPRYVGTAWRGYFWSEPLPVDYMMPQPPGESK